MGKFMTDKRELFDLINRISDGAAMTDEAGRVVLWNRQAENITGIKVEDVEGKMLWNTPFAKKCKCLDQINSLRREYVNDILHHGQKQILNSEFEYLCKSNKNGSTVLNCKLSTYSTDKGLGLYILFGKKVKENHINTLINESTDIISIISEKGIILYENMTARNLLGDGSKKRIGKCAFDDIHPDDKENIVDAIKQLVKSPGEIRVARSRYLFGDNKWRWLEGKATNYIEDPLIRGIVVVLRDISEEKRYEKELMRKEEIFDSIVSNMPGILNVIDKEYNILETNNADMRLEKTPHETVEETRGKKCYSAFMQRDKPCTLCKVEEVLRTGKAVESYTELEDPRKGLKGKAFKIMSFPYKNKKNEIVGVIEYGIDVTELRIKEGQLRESRKRYQELTEQAPVGILSCNRDGEITFVNSTVVDMMGSPSKEETMKINMLTFKPLVESNISERISNCMKNNIEDLFEVNYVSKWGKKSWVKFAVTPKVFEGQVNGASIVIDDITKEKQAEIELKKSEENFRSFFDGSDDIFLVSDKQGFIIHSNKSAINKLGYSKEELLGMNVLDLHSKENQNEAHSIFEKMVAGEMDKCPLPLETKAGFELPVETRIKFGKWNNNEKIFAVCKDLSKEQEALQRFNLLFQNNPAVMAISSIEDNTYIDVNEAFVKKTGYRKEEVLGKRASDLGLIIDPRVFDTAKEELMERRTIKNYEMKIRTKWGKELVGMFSGTIIKSQSNTYFITVMMDVTENRRQQEKIKYMSYHDILTGVYNRRYFEDRLIRLEKSNSRAGVIVADVNGLKLINDAFGHEKGDELLKLVARKICQAFGEDAIVSRIGGDEFAVILENQNCAQTKEYVTKVKTMLENEKIGSIGVSVSFGCQSRNVDGIGIYQVFRQADESMYKNKLIESKSMRHQTVKMIMQTLFEKSNREREHSERVSNLSNEIGLALGLKEKQLNELKIAALMHDIGKISVDSSILDKPGKLEDRELYTIKRHPEVGYQILSKINEYAMMANYVLQHHERWDGKGYPSGVKGEKIYLESRIIAIADAYDAMTSERTYRKALSKEEAIKEIRDNAGKQFDPEIAIVAIEKVLKGK